MGEKSRGPLPFPATAGDRIRQCNADHEYERRHNEIPERAALPAHMIRLPGEKLPCSSIGKIAGNLAEPKAVGRHEKHHDSTKSVQRHQSRCPKNLLPTPR